MLTISRPVYDALVAHAEDGGNHEICGILAGSFDVTASHATNVHHTENVAERPQSRYAIDPAEQLACMESIEASGNDIVGFYHSHPAGPPRPSQTDRSRATWPDRSYVIVSMDGSPFVGSWRWRPGRDAFEGERIAIA